MSCFCPASCMTRKRHPFLRGHLCGWHEHWRPFAPSKLLELPGGSNGLLQSGKLGVWTARDFYQISLESNVATSFYHSNAFFSLPSWCLFAWEMRATDCNSVKPCETNADHEILHLLWLNPLQGGCVTSPIFANSISAVQCGPAAASSRMPRWKMWKSVNLAEFTVSLPFCFISGHAMCLPQ